MSTAARTARRGTSSSPHSGGVNGSYALKIAHNPGGSGHLLEAGWLPRAAAAAAMGMTPYELDRAVRDGAIKRRTIGPNARLYEVFRDE